MKGICTNWMELRNPDAKECCVGTVRKLRNGIKDETKTCRYCPYFLSVEELIKRRLKQFNYVSEYITAEVDKEVKGLIKELEEFEDERTGFRVFIWADYGLVVMAKSLRSALITVLVQYGIEMYKKIRSVKPFEMIWFSAVRLECSMLKSILDDKVH